jgi:ABC-2 type transport system permease protein
VTTVDTTAAVPADGPITGSGSGLLTSLAVIARRSIRKYARTPQILFISTVQGVIFLLIFRYAFGGAIATPGMAYINYLVPGVVTAGVLFTGGVSAVGVTEDVALGLHDRLRSLPMPRVSVLAGRVLADTLLVAVCLAINLVVAFLVGFRPSTGVGPAIGAFFLVVLFGFAFVWVFVALGLLAGRGNPQAAQGIGFLVLPLSFASSAFVPVGSMPGWLQAFAQYQPVTMLINCARTLTGGAPAEALAGHTVGYYLIWSLAWSIGITVVFGALAVSSFQKR